ncbi:hypothetical protein [Streptomyces sp. NPDC048710]|uniref:hypothetical protein n=1 Tax=unclassified Streptomyces TaxID=2593676 RepID=UPI003717F4F5
MDFTADSLLSRAAHQLSPRADELIHDAEQCLRREVPDAGQSLDAAVRLARTPDVDACA